MTATLQVNRDVLLRSLLRRSFRHFVRHFWNEIIPETFVNNWHIDYLAQELQEIVLRAAERKPKEADLVINIPPGTTKSTLTTIMLPAWAWTIDPTLRIITASYSATLSIAHALKSRDIIRSDAYRRLFPEVQIKKDQDNKSQYATSQGGERLATSVGGTITGFHAHLIILDDPINAQEALSDTLLNKASQFIDQTLTTRKIDKAGTPTIMVMQRLHERDPSGIWLNREKDPVKHICLPAIKTADIRPPELVEYYDQEGAGLLDHKRLGVEQLNQLKLRLGSYGWAGQILQSPVPLEGAIWQASWFKIGETVPELRHVSSFWDLAYTKNEKNSASAYVRAGMDASGNLWVLEAGYYFKEFPQLVQVMQSKEGPHIVENKASGKSAVQVLKSQGIPAKEYQVKGADKIARTTLVTPYAEAGKLILTPQAAEILLQDPQQSLLKFPNGAHDDLNDCLVMAMTKLLARPKVVIF